MGNLSDEGQWFSRHGRGLVVNGGKFCTRRASPNVRYEEGQIRSAETVYAPLALLNGQTILSSTIIFPFYPMKCSSQLSLLFAGFDSKLGSWCMEQSKFLFAA